MARRARIVVPGQAMHIVQRGNNRQATFYAEEDYRRYLDILFDYAERTGCLIHAYVLMTNHVHLLLTPQEKVSVAELMQSIGRKYVRYINGAYRRTGTLWEGRYKSAMIDSEHYLLSCSRYIELNPVRAAMVKGPGQYKWSSYHHNALADCDVNLIPHVLYEKLGKTLEERRRAYRGLFKTQLDDQAIKLIRDNTKRETVIGNKEFQQQIEMMLKRRVTKIEHGGDRKSKVFKEGSGQEIQYF